MVYVYPLPQKILVSERYSGDKVVIIGFAETRKRLRVPVGIHAGLLPHHILIVGATGSGKSTTASRLAQRIASDIEDYNVLIIDWHGEYTSLLDKYVYYTPWDMPVSLIDRENIDYTLDIFEDILDLTPPQSYLLGKSLERTISGDIVDLARLIESAEETAGWVREVKYALLRKITPMIRGGTREIFSGEKHSLTTLLSEKHVEPIIIDVSTIQNARIRALYTISLLKIIMTAEKEYRIALFIEEAQNIFNINHRNSFVRKFIAETRKFGVSVVIITQSPSSIIEDIVKNTGIKILHSIRSSTDIEMLRKTTVLPQHLEKILPVLEPGEAVLFSPAYKEPFIIRIE